MATLIPILALTCLALPCAAALTAALTCVAVWDLLFFEGSPVVLFRVALALIEIYDQVGGWLGA